MRNAVIVYASVRQYSARMGLQICIFANLPDFCRWTPVSPAGGTGTWLAADSLQVARIYQVSRQVCWLLIQPCILPRRVHQIVTSVRQCYM